MTKSIRWRMVGIFVLLVVLVMMASGSLIVFQTRSYEYNLIEEQLVTSGNAIKAAVNTEQPITEIKSDIIQNLSAQEELLKTKKVFVLDNQGSIVFTRSVATTEKWFYTAQVMGALSNKPISNFDRLFLSGDETTYIGYATPIIKDDQAVFVIYVVASTKIIQEKIQYMVILIIFSVLLAIVLAVVLAFIFSAFLTKPISALTQKATEMSKGHLDNPIKVFSNDEIGELTINFNKMASSLNRTLAQIASEKNKMETVITHMTDGILVFDNYGYLIHKNPAAIRMLKLAQVSSFKEVFRNLMDVDYSTALRDIEYVTKKINIVVGEAYYSVDMAKYIDVDGTTLGLICVIQDITEHKKLEKMQKEFVANVSHELRTPLTTIKSYTETLLDGAVDDLDLANQFLAVINNESDRMTTLVQDLLELSKLDSKKTAFESTTIDLEKLVFHSVENYRIHANKKNQELLMEGIVGDFYIVGDSNRIEQVLKNILSNAVKYSEEGASVKVSLKTQGNYHIVEVQDTGLGMPKEDLPRIFERFYRVDKARSRAMGGTGLGLAIAKEIIEIHGGKIEVESELNVGTTFKIYFPAYKELVEIPENSIQSLEVD